MALRVVFFGNSESQFSNRHFHALRKARAILAGVVDVPPHKRTSTNPSKGTGQSFATVAAARGIPCYEPESPNAPEFVETIRALSPDLLVAAGYMYRLKPEMLAVPRLLAVNLHASLLPAYRGMHPVFWSLRNGERMSGLTMHVMDPHLDTGAILYQVRVRTRRDDSVATLYERIMKKSVLLIPRLLRDAERGKLQPAVQGSAGASYYSSAHEEDFHLDWSMKAEQLCRWIRVTPGQCFADIVGRRVHFLDADVETIAAEHAPGTLARIGRTACVFAAGEGGLRVNRVVVEGHEFSMASLARQWGLAAGANVSTGQNQTLE